MTTIQPTERFSDRVDNYVKYRPGYPATMLRLFRDRMGIGEGSVVADVGAGTGISTKLFLYAGCTVYAVEPNQEMLAAAMLEHSANSGFHSVAASAENTSLAASSVDLVAAAQAFHWFEPEGARTEFKRILKPGGWVALIWNERQLDTTPFLIAYENLLKEFATDYSKVRHDKIDRMRLENFFQQDYETAEFENSQDLDLEGLQGRLASSSYMPNVSDPVFPKIVGELKTLFANHAESGRITVLYRTRVFYSQF